jgi:NADP-dependent 3-hydroxy acid dehydrogenase YdfG
MNQAAGGKRLDLHFLKLDLQDLRSVKEAAMLFSYQESRLDILINNAGVRESSQFCSARSKSDTSPL